MIKSRAVCFARREFETNMGKDTLTKQREVHVIKLLSVCLLIVLNVSVLAADENLTDPYQILARHFAAIGGLDKIKAEKSSYLEGTFVLEGTGLEGSLKRWQKYPGRSRQEVDLTSFRQTSGDDGTRSWTVDANGKVQFETSAIMAQRRELALHDENFAYLDPNSTIFKLTFEGIQDVQGQPCYVVRKSNTINEDFHLLFISTETFYLLKLEEHQLDNESQTFYYDYRPINGVKHAFLQKTEVLPVQMKQTLTVTTFETNTELDDALFSAPVSDTRDFSMPEGGRSEDIPFQYIENHIFVTVRTNCQESLWVLDTGAGQSVIDREYARELGLEASGTLQGQGAGSTVEFSFVTLPEFEFAGVRFSSQTIVSIDLRSILENAFGFQVNGILGYDFISRFVTKIDFAHELISLYTPENFSYAGSGTQIEMELRKNIPVVSATVDGQYSGKWVLDLGASDVSFHYPFAQKHAFDERPARESIAAGAGGQFKLMVSRFQTIEFGGFIIEKPLISFPLNETVGAFASREFIGNLGNGLFEHFVLYLDYHKQRIILEKGANFAKPPETDNSGLQIRLTATRQIEIFFVSPGTPAEKAGLLKGDIITAINQLDIKAFAGIIAVRKLLREAPATTYQLTVRRGDELKTVSLQLEAFL